MEVQPPTQAQTGASGQEVWDEARLEEAMERLKLLHIKVNFPWSHAQQKPVPCILTRRPPRCATYAMPSPRCLNRWPSPNRPVRYPPFSQLDVYLSSQTSTHAADALFAAFKAARADSQAAVQEFNELMNDVKSQQALARAKESREKDPSGIAPWRHTENPDWFALDSKQVF